MKKLIIVEYLDLGGLPFLKRIQNVKDIFCESTGEKFFSIQSRDIISTN